MPLILETRTLECETQFKYGPSSKNTSLVTSQNPVFNVFDKFYSNIWASIKWDSSASIKVRSLEIQNRIPSSLLTLTFSGVAGLSFMEVYLEMLKRAAEAL